MRKILDIQKQLLPDLTDVLRKRYAILHQVRVTGLIGRRTLASALEMTERVLRAETDFLKAQGLLDISAAGMQLTEAGRGLADEMEPIVKELLGLSEAEEKLRETFGLRQVVIVPGDSDAAPYVKKDLGRAAANLLHKYAAKEDIIAVTGGSTMAEVARHLAPSPQLKNKLFVPARGGLGEGVELQANTIASDMAKSTGGMYRLLHVPDDLGEDAYQSLMQEKNVRDVINVIRSAGIVIHGIGGALAMARRRKADEATIASLQRDGALAEALGYYFDRDGKVVHKVLTLGLQLEDLRHANAVIGVAGGKSKGEAIVSVLKYGHEHVLVTDEAAANEMLRLL